MNKRQIIVIMYAMFLLVATHVDESLELRALSLRIIYGNRRYDHMQELQRHKVSACGDLWILCGKRDILIYMCYSTLTITTVPFSKRS